MNKSAKEQLVLELVQGRISKAEAAERWKELNPAFVVQDCNSLKFKGKRISESKLKELGELHKIHILEIVPNCIEPVTDESDILCPDTGQRLVEIEEEQALNEGPKKRAKRPQGKPAPQEGGLPEMLGDSDPSPPDEEDFRLFRLRGFGTLPSWRKFNRW